MIIISTVLSRMPLIKNGEYLGLYGDHRRFNVAVTRAQALVVLVGHPDTLFQDKYFREFCKHAWNKGAYRGHRSGDPLEEILALHHEKLALGEGIKQSYFAYDQEWRDVL